MLSVTEIYVPSYQRAYSWDCPDDNVQKSQIDVFISDLEAYIGSNTSSPYYFGHFLFEEKGNDRFAVIDGQQRLTTIIIFLSALFSKLKTLRELSDSELNCFEDMIIRRSRAKFSSVYYDNQIFLDYVINQTKSELKKYPTESARRIVRTFQFFVSYLSNRDDQYLTKMLNAISSATCTTHPVKNESEAIQMFIFQNDRGKKPSNLEVLKAVFMYQIHLHSDEERDVIIEEIKSRFENIYKSISTIEFRIREDDVLTFTQRLHFNSLWEPNSLDKIYEILSRGNPLSFIQAFSQSLEESFQYLRIFYCEDEKEHIEIHSLITLGGIAIAIPFVIKAYKFGLTQTEICRLCTALESLVLRHRLIGTRADLISRINDVFKSFTKENLSLIDILKRIEDLKTTKDWWWAYWNNSELEKSIQGGIHSNTAKFLLWKYENYLESQGKSGYLLTRFDKIVSPELEHIAPQTPTNGEPIAAGYDIYDEEFVNRYVNCLGNFLLLSKSHNCSVGNNAFAKKRESYSHTAQQREIQEMTKVAMTWKKLDIENRKMRIIDFVLKKF